MLNYKPKSKRMSVLVDTPLSLSEEPILSSIIPPPISESEMLHQDEESTVYSVPPVVNDKTRYMKKNYLEGYRCVTKTNHNKSSTTYRKTENRTPVMEYFTTKNVTGYPIRNARTGYLYPQYRVGQIHEYLFFKLRLSTQESYEAQHFGLISTTSDNKMDPDVLFYDSPEECESHQQITLPSQMKERWRARYEKLLRLLEKSNPSKTIETPNVLLSQYSTTTSPADLAIKNTIRIRPPSPTTPPPGYDVLSPSTDMEME